LIEKKGGYLLAVKENQKGLDEATEELFRTRIPHQKHKNQKLKKIKFLWFLFVLLSQKGPLL